MEIYFIAVKPATTKKRCQATALQISEFLNYLAWGLSLSYAKFSLKTQHWAGSPHHKVWLQHLIWEFVMTEKPRTEKHEEARNTVPDELKPIFDLLVEDYRFAAQTKHGSPWVSYVCLAELINAGWRPTDRKTADDK